ncbi:MAG: hypothetical protein UH734_08105 [Ruminococcus sp.]|nr:hypothetical protein [Ruminococcus sp.]
MTKLFENKQRRRLRLVMCFIYLFQIFLCTSPYLMLTSSTSGKFKDESVFSMIYKSVMGAGDLSSAGGFVTVLPFFFLALLPIVGFFLCALDKERNAKNIGSLIINFLAVMFMLMVVPANAILIGALVQLLLYIVQTFLASVAMLARLNKERDPEDEKKKKKIPKEEREY